MVNPLPIITRFLFFFGPCWLRRRAFKFAMAGVNLAVSS